MGPLETCTFYHQDPSGGPQRVSSCVGPTPTDPAGIGRILSAHTGWGPATGVIRGTLTFPDVQPGEPGIRQVLDAYNNCGRCHLTSTRACVVQYRGNTDAVLAFLGEGPGRAEDQSGTPFVGPSGNLQSVMTLNAGIDPNRDVFWLNTVGCRPAQPQQKDRPPTTSEMVACSERTTMLFRAVRPRVVVCLGKVATQYFWEHRPPVWSWHHLVPKDHPDDWIMVGVAHHPAYLARVMGVPSMYREYAAQRTFYEMLAEKMRDLTKPSAWRFMPQYALNVQEVLTAWHETT